LPNGFIAPESFSQTVESRRPSSFPIAGRELVELGIQRNIQYFHVDSIFPEYGRFFSKLECKTSLYTTSGARMRNLGLARLTTAIRKASRGEINEHQARELLKAAKATMAGGGG
jgi:hypothetical protein